MSWLRRLRGIFGLATVWGVGGGLLGAGLMLVDSLLFGSLPALGSLASTALGFATLGFVSGGAFASVFTLTERQRTLDEISVGRASMWGFATGALLAGGMVAAVVLNPFTVVSGPLGGLVGGTLALCAVSGGIVGSLAGSTILVAKAAPAMRELGDGDAEGLLSDGEAGPRR